MRATGGFIIAVSSEYGAILHVSHRDGFPADAARFACTHAQCDTGQLIAIVRCNLHQIQAFVNCHNVTHSLLCRRGIAAGYQIVCTKFSCIKHSSMSFRVSSILLFFFSASSLDENTAVAQLIGLLLSDCLYRLNKIKTFWLVIITSPFLLLQ